MPDAIALLSTRRSVPIPMLGLPAPTSAELETILTIGARVPDHGKLAPWRFILYRGAPAEAIGEALAALIETRDGAPLSEGRRRVETTRLTRAPLVIGVVSTAKEHVKIREWEQVLSGGAAAMNIVNAVHAMGYAANWVTEWMAYDDEAKALLGVAPEEQVIGFIHVGTPQEPPSERPRPALADIVTEAVAPVAR
ncbi:nitroreductase [Aurantimonas endophytica]|uniref:nitroreductase family protein n=1 Tax=Aurantimonas endophytica TaxID=1522175 RepID=UPI003AB95ECF